MFKGKKILVGVASSAAMYKSLDLIRRLKKQGADVHVMMTRGAATLISPQLFHAISQNKVWFKMFDEDSDDPMPHVGVLQDMDLVMLVPATASLIGRYAMGLADDLVTTVLLGSKAPVLLAPAMNTAMMEHPLVVEHLDKLRSIGVEVINSVEGELACGVYGAGHLADLDTILLYADKMMTPQDLEGKRVLIATGRTEEPLDPVRVLTNRSSGKMGLAFARTAFGRGADVTVVSGPVEVDYPASLKVISVQTAQEMYESIQFHFKKCDVFVSMAAVCDYRPKKVSTKKWKKTGKSRLVEFVENPHILEEMIAQKKPHQKIVGFALETDDLAKNAQIKRERGVDVLIGNEVAVLGEEEGEFELFYGRKHRSLNGTKVMLGHQVWDWVAQG